MRHQAARAETSDPFWVVGLVASAGGVSALCHVVSALPADFPAALVVVLHVPAHHKSHLAEILARRIPLVVKQAEEGDVLRPGCVYTAPPDRHLIVNPDRTLSLSGSGRVRYVRPAGDVLFASMAVSCKEHAIVGVLTGGDEDGATGVRLVHAMGGITIAQDRLTSEHFSMPHAAIATGILDYILPLDQIGPTLKYLTGWEPHEHGRDGHPHGEASSGHCEGEGCEKPKDRHDRDRAGSLSGRGKARARRTATNDRTIHSPHTPKKVQQKETRS